MRVSLADTVALLEGIVTSNPSVTVMYVVGGTEPQ